ncbi:MAG TPA: HAD-IA family hydrolase [Coleofasciculaceae cyanobacterium]|jgi:HAD superfamily hydrolase (TIGR01509 family)
MSTHSVNLGVVDLELPQPNLPLVLDQLAIDQRIAPQPPYAGLIFDCDGTLADTLPVHFRAWQAALSQYGAALVEDWFHKRTGLTALEFIQEFNQTFGCTIDQHQLDLERQEQFSRLIHQVREVPAVAAIARLNYGKVPMAVASNGQRSVVESTLETIQLRSLFNTIVTLNDVELGKPAPQMFLLAAERMGVAPQDCIVYEDSDLGLEAARRAGMQGIDVRILERTL